MRKSSSPCPLCGCSTIDVYIDKKDQKLPSVALGPSAEMCCQGEFFAAESAASDFARCEQRTRNYYSSTAS